MSLLVTLREIAKKEKASTFFIIVYVTYKIYLSMSTRRVANFITGTAGLDFTDSVVFVFF